MEFKRNDQNISIDDDLLFYLLQDKTESYVLLRLHYSLKQTIGEFELPLNFSFYTVVIKGKVFITNKNNSYNIYTAILYEASIVMEEKIFITSDFPPTLGKVRFEPGNNRVTWLGIE